MRYRIEKDSIGEVQIPAESYYGIHTLRGKENFEITKRGICRQLIKSLAIVKKAAAKANMDAGLLKEKTGKAIMMACDEILNGKHHGQFITDLIQGGAGTSLNMNANEVIANRANELLGGKKGVYDLVHPLDHVNMSQSTNDCIPTAGKIAVIKQLKKLHVETRKLMNAYLDKAEEYKDVIRMGRTHLQEAAPITFKQMFDANASIIMRDLKRIDQAIDGLCAVSMGGTTVGTGFNAHPKYCKKVITHLAKFSGEEIRVAKDLIDATRSIDSFVWASSALTTLALDVSKMANDLRLLATNDGLIGSTIEFEHIQEGSSNLPGKYNPEVPEVVNQVAFLVIGLNSTITHAAQGGELEFNVYYPVILMAMFDEMTNLRHAIKLFNELGISKLKVNRDICKNQIMSSNMIIQALLPQLGYEEAYALANEANREKIPVVELAIKKGVITKEQAELINPEHMTTPGFIWDEKEE